MTCTFAHLVSCPTSLLSIEFPIEWINSIADQKQYSPENEELILVILVDTVPKTVNGHQGNKQHVTDTQRFGSTL